MVKTMKGIKKMCLTILSFVVVITVFTACGNSKDKEKAQDSVSKDLIKSNVSDETAITEKNNLNTTVDADVARIDSSNTEKSSKNKSEVKKIRMVRVDDRTYMDMGCALSVLKCGTADGEILTNNDEYPEKNDESNFGTGYKYQKADIKYLYVDIDNKWQVFQDIAISSLVIPEGVAHFEAEIIEGDKERILVKITDLPNEFNYIFGDKKADEIKPVQITLKDLGVSNGIKNIKKDKLPGKRIQVWFNGEIKGDRPEMSNPIELGEIYAVLAAEEK
ncbi:hypothetical protein GCWU000282_01076 [Catonella morbi ATCC 51271]|uniref:Lipoprotein n=2 Tax=Catonella TaxID=43996 RepID=V2Y4M5_9FIRM|nr:hypothetical protein GCWU000282_01076 [Catonella morbi ATCC 51271]